MDFLIAVLQQALTATVENIDVVSGIVAIALALYVLFYFMEKRDDAKRIAKRRAQQQQPITRTQIWISDRDYHYFQ